MWFKSFLSGIQTIILGINVFNKEEGMRMFSFLPFISFIWIYIGIKYSHIFFLPSLVVLENVEQCCIKDLPIKLRNPPICLEFLHHFLEGIIHKLSLLPDGSFLLAERQPDLKEFKFSIMNEFEMDPIKFFGKEFVVPIFDQKRIECSVVYTIYH